ncbi:MAG: acyltransferase [Marinosulfonomonas sp.]|nr:acyltransferase [Marinosulfonomonas sp.]
MAKNMHLLRKYGDTDFITGLRAIAATMVVIIHTGAFVDFGIIGQAITNAGKYGVDIFFVISGYTIAKTFSEAENYRAYLTRRIMRIIPMYWFTISVAMILWASGYFSLPYWMQKYGSQPDIYNLLMHLSMISYLDYRIANSILGVEWSIPVEVFWYVFLPPLVYFGKTIFRAIGIILALLILTAILTYVSNELFGTPRPVKWGPIPYGHLFFLGVTSFYLRDRFKAASGQRPLIWIGAAVTFFWVAQVVDFGGRSTVIALSTAILIVYMTPSRAGWVTKPLTVRPMLFLGSISYSIYLLHILVLHVLRDLSLLPAPGLQTFLVVYAITVVLSTATYLLIEKPTNQYGRRMVKSF